MLTAIIVFAVAYQVISQFNRAQAVDRIRAQELQAHEDRQERRSNRASYDSGV